MRRADSTPIGRNEAPWLFDRLDALFTEAAVFIGTIVDPVFEPVQIVRYRTGDHFQWHTDAGVDRGDARRISASVELSDPAAYEGGLLEIAPGRMLPQRAPPRGHATLFPSRALHRVTPVTRGTRYALVAWTGLNPA
jgi:PKHD-type hydroxylase